MSYTRMEGVRRAFETAEFLLTHPEFDRPKVEERLELIKRFLARSLSRLEVVQGELRKASRKEGR